MRKLLIALLLHLSLMSWSQEPAYDGVVVDSRGVVWVGKVTILRPFELFSLKADSVTEIFAAWRVKDLRYYDNVLGLSRRWITFPEKNSVVKFYEVVLGGDILVVRRPHFYNRSLKNHADFSYYFVEYGVLSPLRKFRKLLYHRLRPEVDDWSLNPNTPGDAMQYIQRHNQMLAASRRVDIR